MNDSNLTNDKPDGLEIARQKWAEEKAAGLWDAAAKRQAEREHQKKQAHKPHTAETQPSLLPSPCSEAAEDVEEEEHIRDD